MKKEVVKIELDKALVTQDNVVGNDVKCSLPKSMYLEEAVKYGVTEDTIKQVNDFNSAYLASAVHLSVETAGNVFLNNKDSAYCTTTIPFGLGSRDAVVTRVTKEKEILIPGTDKKIVQPSIRVQVSTAMSKLSDKKIKGERHMLEDMLANGTTKSK